MKNITLIIIAFCLLLIACKKESKHNPPKQVIKKYAATWHLVLLKDTTDNISVANSKTLFSIPNLNAAPDTLTLEAAGITNYYYIAYDNNGKEVSRIHRYANSPGMQIRYINNGVYTMQHSQLVSTPTAANFDTVIDSLPEEVTTPNIFVVAAASDMSINTSNELLIIYNVPVNSVVPFYNYSTTAGVYPNTSNTYMGFAGLNPNHNTVLAMGRIVGQLQINIEGVIPANADHFRFVLDGESMGAELSGYMSPVGSIDTSLTTNVPISSADRAKTTYQYSKFIINTTKPINLTINCYDASNKLIVSRTIPGLQFEKKKKIVLSGKLFDNTVGGHININPNYGPDSTVVHF
jgi:hypothetical protein